MVNISPDTGHITGDEWIKEIFIDKAELFLRVLDSKWAIAEREAKSIASLLERLGVGRGSSILDLGCGNGRIAVNLAKLGYRVVGVDISPLFISDAEKKALEHGVSDRVEFLVGDARELDKILGDRLFDAVIICWTTLIGYYGDRKTDTLILEEAWRATRPNGYLLILGHLCLETLSVRQGICGQPHYISDLDEELVVVEKPRYDPPTATLHNTWVFYRKNGKNLLYVDEINFNLRIYAFHELVEIAGEAGWKLYTAYSDITTLRPYRPGTGTLNVVFVKQGQQ